MALRRAFCSGLGEPSVDGLRRVGAAGGRRAAPGFAGSFVLVPFSEPRNGLLEPILAGAQLACFGLLGALHRAERPGFRPKKIETSAMGGCCRPSVLSRQCLDS